MQKLYGSLDLTAIGKIIRQQPDLVREVNFKDGTHKLLNIDVYAHEQPDQYNNVAAVKAACKKDRQQQGLNYYIANLKQSQFQPEAPAPAASPAGPAQTLAASPAGQEPDLPF